MVLRDFADGLILGVFLFLMAVCVLLMITALLKQGIWSLGLVTVRMPKCQLTMGCVTGPQTAPVWGNARKRHCFAGELRSGLAECSALSMLAAPPCSRADHPPAPWPGGGSGAVPDASRRRWARAIIRAKMRSPVCICSRSWAVCCGDVPLGVFLPAVPDFRLLPEGRGFPFALVLSRIASRWGSVNGPPCLAESSNSGTCRSPLVRMDGIGPPVSSPAPLLSVRHRDAGKNLPQVAALVRVITCPNFSALLSVFPAGFGRMRADSPP